MIGTNGRARGARTALLLLAMAPGLASGQQESRAQAPRGWLGITYDGQQYPRWVQDGGQGRFAVTITEVWTGSPAGEAGVLAGDLLLGIDGEPPTPEVFQALRRDLSVGDRVRLDVERNGVNRRFAVVAAARPEQTLVFESPAWVSRIDSVREAVFRSLEDVRLGRVRVGEGVTGVEILTDSGPDHVSRIRVIRRGPGGVAAVEADEVEVTLAWNYTFELPELGEPFPLEAFVVHTERTDELMEDLTKLRQARWEARRSEIRRERVLAASLAPGASRIDRDDAALTALRERRESLEADIERLKIELERVSREQLAAHRTQTRVMAPRVRVADVLEVRPLLPYILGPNYVAGAHIAPLTPDLASYFSVASGLLVTQIVPGSLADEAGLVAGDVIVEAGDEPVTTTGDLRGRFYAGTGPVELVVVRKGNPVPITLRW